MAEECEDPEEAAAWAAMREAFAEDEGPEASSRSAAASAAAAAAARANSRATSSGASSVGGAGNGGSGVADLEPDDPEEAEAWRELRRAFGDAAAGAAAGAGGPRKAGAPVRSAPKGKGAGTRESTPASAGKAKVVSATVVAAAAEEAFTSGGAISETWLQSQVDRLVGEVQRSAGGPFAPDLLRAVWRLPLGDQHDVLLGAAGTDLGLVTKVEAASKLWALIEDEVRARGVKRPGGAKRKAPVDTSSAPTKRPVAAEAADAGRSRSRSPSI